MPIDTEWMSLQLDPDLHEAATRGGDLTAIGQGSRGAIWRRVEGGEDHGGGLPSRDAGELDFDDFVAVMTCADREVLRILSEDQSPLL